MSFEFTCTAKEIQDAFDRFCKSNGFNSSITRKAPKSREAFATALACLNISVCAVSLNDIALLQGQS